MNKNRSYKVQSIAQVLISLVILVLINILATYEFKRFDLTGDQRYSLKESTIDLLENDERFDDNLYVKVYFEGEFPAEWERLRKEIEIKLEEYRAYAGQKFDYDFININEDPAAVDQLKKQLIEKGLRPVRIATIGSGDQESREIFPGAVLSYSGKSGKKDVAVNFFESEYPLINVPREQMSAMIQQAILELEYNLTSGIVRAITTDVPTIGFLEGHGELEDLRLKYVMDLLEEEHSYATKRVSIKAEDSAGNLRDDVHALDDIDLLVIAKPTKPFSERHKYLIDQYIMKGGASMWFVDGLADHRDTLKYRGVTRAIDHRPALNLRDQLFRYGVRIDNNLVLDAVCAPIDVPVQNQEGQVRPRILPWYFYPLVNRPSETIHPITNNIAPVKTEYTSTVSLVNQDDKDIEHTVLLSSSGKSYYRRAPVDIFYNIVIDQPQKWESPTWDPENPDNRLPVAVLIEGKFTSAFKNRLAPESASKLQPIEKSTLTRMIVAGDGDIIKNDLYSDPLNQSGVKPIPLDKSVYGEAFQEYSRLHYGNKMFVLNAVDYLLGDATLIDTRSKFIDRSLDIDKVAEQKGTWQFLTTVLPVALVLLFGIGYLIIRRYRFAK